jgi:hypothetical protein
MEQGWALGGGGDGHKLGREEWGCLLALVCLSDLREAWLYVSRLAMSLGRSNPLDVMGQMFQPSSCIYKYFRFRFSWTNFIKLDFD